MEENQDGNVTKLDLGNSQPAEADDNVTKLNLNETAEETTSGTTDETGVDGSDEAAVAAPEQEEVQQEVEAQESVVEEITSEEVAEAATSPIDTTTGKVLPEAVDKLVKFMDETGGDIQDYLRLNRDLEELSPKDALLEYYRETKPHLDDSELSFLMEDQFSYDEEYDDEKDIMRKKLAIKEETSRAKSYLENKKSKYYEEIKNGSKLTPEANEAIKFFNRYNKEQEATKTTVEKQRNAFDQKTSNLFNEEFKGFEYNIGDKKFRYNVKNAEEVKNTQSDINNFVKRFLAEDNTMSDAKGYHKSLYTAMNADNIAQHFYEQGKSDALKDSIAKSKNVSMQPRQGLGEVKASGTKFKILSGDTSADFKVKLNRGKK